MTRPTFDKKIKTTGAFVRMGDRYVYQLDPSEEQVIANRTGPRRTPPRKKEKPDAKQTSWLGDAERDRAE